MKNQTRRTFLKRAAVGAAGVAALPTILPQRLWGAGSANSRIQVAQIGIGRMGSEDIKGVMSQSIARVVAVCDLDSKRLATAKQRVIDHYKENGEAAGTVQTYS